MKGDAWRLDDLQGILVARCEPLLAIPGIAHAFSTRRADARDDFDLGPASNGAGACIERRARFLSVTGFSSSHAAILRQVHGDRIVSAAGHSAPLPEADAIYWMSTDGNGPVPSVRTADCVPVLLVDRNGTVAAAIHAGWRGTAAAIAARSVETLASLGVAPGELLVALGPAIGPCCYEVGDEVVVAVAASAPRATALATQAPTPNHSLLDLHRVLEAQLVGAGVQSRDIYRAPWCTRCRADLFFSYRREGASAGRMMASIGAAR